MKEKNSHLTILMGLSLTESTTPPSY